MSEQATETAQPTEAEQAIAGFSSVFGTDVPETPEPSPEATEQPPAPPIVETPPVESAPAVVAPPVETPGAEDTPAEPAPAVSIVKNEMFKDGEMTIAPPAEISTPDVFSLETMEEVENFALENFETKDLSEAAKSYKDMGVQVTELTKSKTELDDHTKFIEGLPPALYRGLQLHNEGKDWREAIKDDSALDITKKAEDHKPQDLVDAFNPDSFSKEDWAEYGTEDIDPGMKKGMDAVLAASKVQYVAKQNELLKEQQSLVDGQTEKTRLFGESITTTMGSFTSGFEAIGGAPLSVEYAGALQKSIENNEIVSHFYNNDGSLKKDAAQSFAMARDGIKLIESIKQAAASKAITEERQRALDRGADTPPIGGGGAAAATTTAQNIEEGVAGIFS